MTEYIQNHSTTICYVIGGLMAAFVLCMYCYARGFTTGGQSGEAAGYDKGFTAGELDGKSRGYTQGWDEGTIAGFQNGERSGITEGYQRAVKDHTPLHGESGKFVRADGTYTPRKKVFIQRMKEQL